MMMCVLIIMYMVVVDIYIIVTKSMLYFLCGDYCCSGNDSLEIHGPWRWCHSVAAFE